MTVRSWLITCGALAVMAGFLAALQPKQQANPPVPILSKLPSIPGPQGHLCPSNPRVSDQLKMLVTPRIIIQDEEEAKLLGQTP